MSNPSRQHSNQWYYMAGRVRRRGKQGKVGVKRKWWVLLSFPNPKKEIGGSHPGWNQGDRPPNVKGNPGRLYR